jgi:hypothetical protein
MSKLWLTQPAHGVANKPLVLLDLLDAQHLSQDYVIKQLHFIAVGASKFILQS